MKLSELKIGEKALIVRVGGTGQFRKRILEMGFVQGKEVSMVQGAPMADPIQYRILGYDVSLRRVDAEEIEVELFSQDDSAISLKEEQDEQGQQTVLVPLEPLSSRTQKSHTFKTLRVALVGNPNCGKTSLFNQASGSHEHVGNYSGVTVERKTAYIHFDGYRIELIDLPGAYSLSPYSPEEVYIRNYLTDLERPDLVLNVLDTTNIERNLYLTVQIKEMGLPVIAALNMYDEFTERGDELDYLSLSRLLGVPMIPTICRTGLGLQALFTELIKVWEGLQHLDDDLLHPERGRLRPLKIYYGHFIESSITTLVGKIGQHLGVSSETESRHLAIKLIEKDSEVAESLMHRYSKGAFILSARDYELKRLANELNGGDTEELMTDARYGYISGALRETYVGRSRKSGTRTEKIDRWVTNKYLGFPIFLLLMYLMFEATFTLGQYPMDWIDASVSWLSDLVQTYMNDGPLKDLLVDGVLAGVGGIVVFLPNILILYFFISIFEDTGYMSRAAFIMDKLMHRMGLHGKSFIPLIMGFGCNVPAVMATRTIESRKSRIITMLVVPFMSCSARLPVYLLLSGALMPERAGLVLFALYLIGVGIAIVSARVLRATYFKGEDIPFVMELPPYRIPTTKAILRHMWLRAEQYLHKMGSIILVASITIWFLGYFPRQELAEQEMQASVEMVKKNTSLSLEEKAEHISTLEHSYKQFHQERSLIGRMGKAIEPVISPLGFDWKMGISLLSGLAAKEVVVSTLGIIYTGDGDDSEEATQKLGERITQEKRSDGTPSFTPLVAFAFMIFVLIYFPCIATIIAIGRESGSWRWGAFSVLYSCSLAWFLAFVVYQTGRYIL